MPEICAAHMRKTFGAAVAVDDLRLEVAAGAIYGLVGPDGAGKTTSIRLLCGALRPDPHDGGEPPSIHIAGVDMLRQTDLARQRLGYLPQRFSMYEELTVMENLRFFAEVRGLSDRDWKPRSLEILAFVGLEDFMQRLAGQLSGGMKQKLGLAVALVHRPQVLLLDEPTTGVDPLTRQDFWQLIIRLVAEEGVAVLVSTPYMDEAARCHQVGFMSQGRLLVEGRPDDLRRQLEGRILEVQGTPLRLLRNLAQADPDVEDAQMFGEGLHLRVAPGKVRQVQARLRKALPRQGAQLIQMRPIRAGLEDVFISLLEDSSMPEKPV